MLSVCLQIPHSFSANNHTYAPLPHMTFTLICAGSLRTRIIFGAGIDMVYSNN